MNTNKIIILAVAFFGLCIFSITNAISIQESSDPSSLRVMPKAPQSNITANSNSLSGQNQESQNPTDANYLNNDNSQTSGNEIANNNKLPAEKNSGKNKFSWLVVAVIFVVISFVYMAIKNKWFQKAE